MAWAPKLARASEGFKEEYFAPLAQLEESNFWFLARNQLILWALKTYFPNLTSWMEVGCGTGFVLKAVSQAFPSTQLVGSEIFVEGLSHAAERIPNATFMQMDARQIPFVEEFDGIGAFDVLEHIEEDELVLQNLYQALKPRGGLLVSVPQHMWLWSAADDYACHVRRYTALELHEKIEKAGFQILLSTSFVSLILPVMMLARLRPKKNFDPLDEFRISPWVNKMLKKILDIERTLIRWGVRFPLGGSRIVVARKIG